MGETFPVQGDPAHSPLSPWLHLVAFCSASLPCLPWFPVTGLSPQSFISVQSLSCVQLFATPRTAAHQASLSITNSQSLLKLMSMESVMPSSHLISSLKHPPEEF